MTQSVQRGEKIREGKSKVLFEAVGRADAVIQHFKDDATAFNAQKRGTIVAKGRRNARITTLLFEKLEKLGVATHYLAPIDDTSMLVRKVDIAPVEVVVRNIAAGSLVKRLAIEKGRELTPPLVEYFYKSDELGDPLIGEGHIAYFGWMTAAELETARETALIVNSSLIPLFDALGLRLVDFKLEFGRAGGKLLLADEITPDGCRLWDKKTGESVDKDRFRHDMGQVEEAYERVCAGLEELLSKEKR